ncbi:ECF transporter S component [Bacillus swezeyi]|uniref:ABC transporter ATP-binding protein n=1 Tax=Bacillus swezeyi TaxID=1925020 RepID=A0A1R1S1P3_9BACI|nr:ECF transporter S component [Bacillus swezeyi]MEC1259014.1 ECF transporter S component [Bacillus swezeyi]MED1738007.1 ECF transporter S component [Bacillus swezeyi]MED2928025.1 ECF transporter S component [Bacillus swezeyi]MED2942285.1 ECF transporter S component [Bacillus swezeyi]MED2965063.1 ECF transporter S component [Bacillus swezeyi]
MNWNMKEVVMTVILAVACGVIYLGWSTLWIPVSAIVGPVGANFMFGIWVIASPIVAYIIRKPGAALIAETAAAAVELLTGSHFGLSALLIGVFQGAGAEIAFAMFRYKRYNLFTLMLSGALAAVGSMAYSLMANGFAYYTTETLILTLAIQIISGIILGGWLAKAVVGALAKTGVLDQYEIMKEHRKKDESNEFISRMQ